MCEERTRMESPDESQAPTDLPLGISAQPTEEQFHMSEREMALIDDLYDWGDRSNATHWVLGKPLGANG